MEKAGMVTGNAVDMFVVLIVRTLGKIAYADSQFPFEPAQGPRRATPRARNLAER